MISWRSTSTMNGKECCQTSASLRWKTPRPAIKLRSTRPTARRERVLAVLWTSENRNLPGCCAGTISTRLPCKPAKIICRNCVPFLNNASAAFAFDERGRHGHPERSAADQPNRNSTGFLDFARNDGAFANINSSGGGVPRYCAADRLFADLAVVNISRSVCRAHGYRS